MRLEEAAMSRAFVKDDTGGPDPIIERPAITGPNYVTPRGLAGLQAFLAQAETAGDEREIRYYRDRIDTAIVVERTLRVPRTVEFGASVTAHDASGAKLSVRIVGADEADPANGSVSFESPIAAALIGRSKGERVIVARPAGPIEYTIDAIAYE